MAYSRSENTISSVSSPLSQIPQALIMWKAAIYIRLSKDDGDKQESNSVTNQREILKEHLKLHPDIELYDIYIDDGWSGTNFDRPSFLRMMEDIYSGKVNCVIVKGLSRFCRNASEGGQYLDNVFVRYRVRFIAINNGIDTTKFSFLESDFMNKVKEKQNTDLSELYTKFIENFPSFDNDESGSTED